MTTAITWAFCDAGISTGSRTQKHVLAYVSQEATGVVVPLPALRPLWCEQGMQVTAEITGVLGNDVGMGQGPSPVEARVGVVARPTPSVTIGVRAGTGVNDEIGAPRLRATLELSFAR